MIATVAQLKSVMPQAPEPWLLALIQDTENTTIDTPFEMASFVAQVAHESNEFTQMEESLNYSAQRLMQVWPRRFPDMTTALQYAQNAEKLGNFVYANRMGNGPPETGDGYRFRGRGPIQITGYNNYHDCGLAIEADLTKRPELLLDPNWGIKSSLWYWHMKKLDQYDDDMDVKVETRAVNGGTLGLKVRQQYFDRCYAVLTGRA